MEGNIMLKSNARWVRGYLTEVDDGRGHSVTMDLPSYQNGEDTAATALEYIIMGYAGCTVTMFRIVVDKMRLQVDSVNMKVEAEKPGEMETVTKMISVFTVVTNESEEKMQKALEKARQMCPVGRIFDMTTIPAEIKLVIERP
ncbi:MAG: OsmC family protein [Candidatus Hodarchaeales archaeon]|jgi:putative redox protein